MYPQEEPIAIEVKLLERKKKKLLSDLEHLNNVRKDKLMDMSARSPSMNTLNTAQIKLNLIENKTKKLQDALDRGNNALKQARGDYLIVKKQVYDLDRQLEEKRVNLSKLNIEIQTLRENSDEYVNNKFKEHQKQINKEKEALKEKGVELHGKARRLESIASKLKNKEEELKQITEANNIDKIQINILRGGINNDYSKLEALSKEMEEKSNKTDKALKDAENIKEKALDDKFNVDVYVKNQKEKIDKIRTDIDNKLKGVDRQLAILKDREKTVSIKEKQLKTDRAVLEKRIEVVQKQSERIRYGSLRK